MTYRIREVTVRLPRRIGPGGARVAAGTYYVAEEAEKIWAFRVWRRLSREYHGTREGAQREIDRFDEEYTAAVRAMLGFPKMRTRRRTPTGAVSEG